MLACEKLDCVDESDPVPGKRRLPFRFAPFEDRGILAHHSTRTLVNTLCIYNAGRFVQPLGHRTANA